ncbi:MAG: 5'/3'-nucleotidase SurE [Candidatus Pacebacteria bacterium]|nr:5'/3'-nucleotidase SurE [Candidatus Paceibacterota bacterium]
MILPTRILLSNDDGIDAEGLKVLRKIAHHLTDDITICAPLSEQSGAGHSLSLRRPLRLHKRGAKKYAIDGTPTDSVLLAVNKVMAKRKPTLLLSGVNRGGNLGEDVTYSGTIAAAMEGALLGIPSVALSMSASYGSAVKWQTPLRHGEAVLRWLMGLGWPVDIVMNVNFPDCLPDQVKGIRVTHQGFRKIGDHLGERTDLYGEPYFWLAPLREEKSSDPEADIFAVQQNYISVTPLSLDLTARAEMQRLHQASPSMPSFPAAKP